MDKKIFVDRGGVLEEFSNSEKFGEVHFPVCLAIKYDNDVSEECPDFVLNLQHGEVFVKTHSPIPKGSLVLMHFYIPPENKLLAEIKGKVIKVNKNNPAYAYGMFIKFKHSSQREIEGFVGYLEEKKHLVDKKA